MLRARSNLYSQLFCLFSLVLITGCDPGPGPEPGFGNNQQIFERWRMSEIIKVGCNDANNNLRRSCTDCPLLVLSTDNAFELIGEDESLLLRGTFRVVNDRDIIFDPSIFANTNVTDVRYSLITGALKFDYIDEETDCAVTESYILSRAGARGD